MYQTAHIYKRLMSKDRSDDATSKIAKFSSSLVENCLFLNNIATWYESCKNLAKHCCCFAKMFGKTFFVKDINKTLIIRSRCFK